MHLLHCARRPPLTSDLVPKSEMDFTTPHLLHRLVSINALHNFGAIVRLILSVWKPVRLRRAHKYRSIDKAPLQRPINGPRAVSLIRAYSDGAVTYLSGRDVT